MPSIQWIIIELHPWQARFPASVQLQSDSKLSLSLSLTASTFANLGRSDVMLLKDNSTEINV